MHVLPLPDASDTSTAGFRPGVTNSDEMEINSMTPEEHDSIMDELVRIYRAWADGDDLGTADAVDEAH